MKPLRLLIAVLLVASMPLRAADAQTTTVFENADFILSDDVRPPDDAARWERLSLPHRWHDTHPGVTGLGWYRIKFDLARIPPSAQAVNIAHWRSRFVDFYVNGFLIGGSRDVTSAVSVGLGTGVYLTIAPSLLRVGENVIHARMRTAVSPVNIQGLGRVTYGDARPVRRTAVADLEWGFYAERTFLAMALAAGLITLFVWFARRSDRVILWFSIACLCWALAGILFNALRWFDLGRFLGMLYQYVVYGLVVPAVVLSLRTVDLKWPRVEAAMWAVLAIEVTTPLWVPLISDGMNTTVALSFLAINAALLLVGASIILYAAERPIRWPMGIEVAALIAMAGCLLHELARFLGWIDVEAPVLRPFHIPVMLLAIGAAIYERHVAAIWRMERANFELERRVAAKVREIEDAHARIEEANRAHTLAQERQRILADMHDGVGASLVALLRFVESGKADAHDLELRVRAALQELRIAVDALEPAEGDLAAVLGKLRYRLEPLIESAGVRFVWEVAELPRVEALEPTAVFSIQRIVLEAIANVLNHASAREIRVSVGDQAARGVEIRIADDGKGFDPNAAVAGLGLRNMRARAERLGAELEIGSNPAGGTTVSLLVPYSLQRSAVETPDLASSAGPAALPTFAPAPG